MSKKIFCLIIISLNSLLFATEYYVDGSSIGGKANDTGPGSLKNPWQTINRAFATVAEGDTLWVRGGSYNEKLNVIAGGQINRPLSIKAYPNEEVILNGNGTVINIDGTKGKGGNYLEIEGFTIYNTNNNADTVLVSQAAGVGLKKLKIKGGRTGIMSTECKCLKILANEIKDCSVWGISIWIGRDVIVADNHVYHIGKWTQRDLMSSKEPGGDGICIRAPADLIGAKGIIDKIDIYSSASLPAGKTFARFCLKDAQSGEPVKLNFMRAWPKGIRGQDEKGTESYPTVLLPYCSANPQFMDDKLVPGGTVRLPSGEFAFPLRNTPEYGNKAYSPDEKYAIFETGGTPVEELARAKCVCLYCRFPSKEHTGLDLQVLRNEVDNCARQGILITRFENVLIKDNKTHHNGATGIQVEGQCRNFWVDGNESYANSQGSPNETGLWMWGVSDCVVQNNKSYENTRGLWIGKASQILVRKNIIYDNCGQHVKGFYKQTNQKNQTFAQDRAMGICVSGRGLNILPECPWTTESITIVHNTIAGNGTDKIINGAGGVSIGGPFLSDVDKNIFVNNILTQNDAGRQSLCVMEPGAVIDGNLYYNYGNKSFTVIFKEGERRWFAKEGPGITTFSYDVFKPDELQKYRDEKHKDEHSVVENPKFVNSGNKDFHLQKESIAVDRGLPLAKTVSEGTGTTVPVDCVAFFSAGFKMSDGKTLVEGDEIMIGKTHAKILKIDKDARLIELDRRISWIKGASVTYPYNGKTPDIGALESE